MPSLQVISLAKHSSLRLHCESHANATPTPQCPKEHVGCCSEQTVVGSIDENVCGLGDHPAPSLPSGITLNKPESHPKRDIKHRLTILTGSRNQKCNQNTAAKGLKAGLIWNFFTHVSGSWAGMTSDGAQRGLLTRVHLCGFSEWLELPYNMMRNEEFPEDLENHSEEGTPAEPRIPALEADESRLQTKARLIHQYFH